VRLVPNVIVDPIHTLEGPAGVITGAGKAFTVTVLVLVPIQPLASVTVTVINGVPAATPVTIPVVAPTVALVISLLVHVVLLQVPDAVNVIVDPTHTLEGPAGEIVGGVGRLFTVTVVVVAVEAQVPLFTISVYVPATAGLITGFCVVDV
jgi:hypothetical protein